MNKEPHILLQVLLTDLISVKRKNSLLMLPMHLPTSSAAETCLANELLYVRSKISSWVLIARGSRVRLLIDAVPQPQDRLN
jgi:hypothetical protein